MYQHLPYGTAVTSEQCQDCDMALTEVPGKMIVGYHILKTSTPLVVAEILRTAEMPYYIASYISASSV